MQQSTSNPAGDGNNLVIFRAKKTFVAMEAISIQSDPDLLAPSIGEIGAGASFAVCAEQLTESSGIGPITMLRVSLKEHGATPQPLVDGEIVASNGDNAQVFGIGVPVETSGHTGFIADSYGWVAEERARSVVCVDLGLCLEAPHSVRCLARTTLRCFLWDMRSHMLWSVRRRYALGCLMFIMTATTKSKTRYSRPSLCNHARVFLTVGATNVNCVVAIQPLPLHSQLAKVRDTMQM